MTDFDLIYLFNEFFNTTFARLNDFMAGLFAMLVAAYFIAGRLTRTMAGLVVTLYSLFSMATIVPAIAATDRMTLAALQIRAASEVEGSELSQLISILPTREFIVPFMLVMMIAAYVSSVIFFYQMRKTKDPGDLNV